MIHSKGEQDSNANETKKQITEVPMVKLKFKVLLLLHQGENEIKFDFLGVQDTLRILYRKVKKEYFVRYKLCSTTYITYNKHIIVDI